MTTPLAATIRDLQNARSVLHYAGHTRNHFIARSGAVCLNTAIHLATNASLETDKKGRPTLKVQFTDADRYWNAVSAVNAQLKLTASCLHAFRGQEGIIHFNDVHCDGAAGADSADALLEKTINALLRHLPPLHAGDIGPVRRKVDLEPIEIPVPAPVPEKVPAR